MSTVDPAEARRRYEAARDPSRGPGTALILGVLIALGLWIFFGLGLADVFRYPVGSLYLAPDLRPPNDTPGLLWAVFVGAFGGAIAGAALQTRLIRVFGTGGGMAAPTAIALAGIALGLLGGAALYWVRPPAQGSFAAAGPDAGGADAWGAGAWLAWTSRYWLPLLLAVIALLLFVRALRAKRTRGRRMARVRQVVETGRKVRGFVTEAADTGVEILDRPRIRYTVKFVDHLGTERWVTKTSTFDRAAVPRADDHVVVWFDPENPGDESSIPIGFGSRAEIKRALAGKGGLTPEL